MKSIFVLMFCVLSTVQVQAQAEAQASLTYLVTCTFRTPANLSSRYDNNLTVLISGKRDNWGNFAKPTQVELRNNTVKDRFVGVENWTGLNDDVLAPITYDESYIGRFFSSASGTVYVATTAKDPDKTVLEIQTYYYGIGPVNAGFLYSDKNVFVKTQGTCDVSFK